MTDEQLTAIRQCADVSHANILALIDELRRMRSDAFTLIRERGNYFEQVKMLRADIERIGRERDQMVAANVELQERLSKLEDDGK